MTACGMTGDFKTRQHWPMLFITETCQDCGGQIWLFQADPPSYPRENRVHASKHILDQVQQGEMQAIQRVIEEIWEICRWYADARRFVVCLEQLQPDLSCWKAVFERIGDPKLLRGLDARRRERESQPALSQVDHLWRTENPLWEWREEIKATLQRSPQGLVIGISEWSEIKEGGLFYWRYPEQPQRARGIAKCEKMLDYFWCEETKDLLKLLWVSLPEKGGLAVKELCSLSKPKRGALYFQHHQLGELALFYYLDANAPHHTHYLLFDLQGEQLQCWEGIGAYHIAEQGICTLNEREGEYIYTVTLRSRENGEILARSAPQIFTKELKPEKNIFFGVNALCCTSSRRGKWHLWFQEGELLIEKKIEPSEYSYPQKITTEYPEARLTHGGGKEIDILVSYDYIQPWKCIVLNTKTDQRAVEIEREQKPDNFSYCYSAAGVWLLIDRQVAYILPTTQQIRWITLHRSMKCVSISTGNRLLLVSNDDSMYHILVEETGVVREISDAQLQAVGDVFFGMTAMEWIVL